VLSIEESCIGEVDMTTRLKLTREPLTRRAVQAMRDAIFAGEYLPGQRLREEDLAASLGVSRNVVREAFWQLEAQGLVESDDYRGKWVSALDFKDMAELIPLRLALESLAATWAARNVTPEGTEALRKQASKFSANLQNFSQYAEVDFELHEMIWQLADNRQMARMLDRIAGPMIALQGRVYQPLLSELIKKESEAREGSHYRIVEAICSGKPARARLAMQKHILAFWQMWLRQASLDEKIVEARETINDTIQVLETLASLLEASPNEATTKADLVAPEATSDVCGT
jgi:DNA-binding GntR family transcriptional regulator